MDEDNHSRESVVQEVREELPRHWRSIILYIVVAIVVATVVVFGVRSIYRHEHPPVKTTPVSVKKTSARPSFSGSTSPAKTATTTPTTASGLPNSGPGPVFAIFTGSVLAAASLHYIVSSRRKYQA